jgi:hypothetical protein
MASQMANVSSEDGDQSVLWNSVGVYASSLPNLAAEAPTSSYREIQELAYEKEQDLIDLFKNFSSCLTLPDQTGIICFYGDKILGVEFYVSNSLWTQFSESVLKGFLSDQVFMKYKTISNTPEANVGQILSEEFSNIDVEEKASTGAGRLYQFSHKKWQGMTLQYHKEPVHFYATKRQIDLFKDKKTRLRSQGTPRPEILFQEMKNQASREQIIVEQHQK